MTRSISRLSLNIIIILMMTLAAASCGRRGALEAPPNANVVSVDEYGEAVPETEEVEKVDKPFILDPLL